MENQCFCAHAKEYITLELQGNVVALQRLIVASHCRGFVYRSFNRVSDFSSTLLLQITKLL